MKSVGSQSHTDSDFSAVRRATAYAISPYKPKQASSKASPPEKPETVARRRSRRKESSVWERTVLTRSRPANRQEGHEPEGKAGHTKPFNVSAFTFGAGDSRFESRRPDY
ncbi:MAG: hypothetical protein DMG41_01625 [Acidobacteria bacterium]|nr:MAG: hypothetical protein AUH13_29295 [Acidobacteria bacterium 13_2_20CM_58_27]PYT91619.1 MAG: hypothetical protein DMG41_01625 [Acidobacteriota bacterium]